MDQLKKYQALNNSFKKSLVFNFGSEQGFYSEFNNMVFAILYCLKYKYRFILYSNNSKFKINKGWEDFFEPFCDSTSLWFHKKFNRKTEPPRIKKKYYYLWCLYRTWNKNTSFTYELWNKFYNAEFENEYFEIPELEISGNLRAASGIIVNMIYRFKPDIKLEIEKLTSSLNLPTKYVSLNIRRGDKNIEYKFMPLSVYTERLANLSTIKNVFVLTDDFETINLLENSNLGLQFYTLVESTEKGYVHSDFIKKSKQEKKAGLIKLFTSIEIICKSEVAIGTYTANPGIFIGMRLPDDKFISIQNSSWYQFQTEEIAHYIVK